MSRKTYMRSWKSHRLTHKLGALSQGLSCHWFILFFILRKQRMSSTHSKATSIDGQ
jgi:hypothetical protein